jgi:hypothetical protein
MQALHIDFGATRPRSPWIGRVMLAGRRAGRARRRAVLPHGEDRTLGENQARLAQRTTGSAARRRYRRRKSRRCARRCSA